MTLTAVYRDAIRWAVASEQRRQTAELTDEELLDRFRVERDERAFEELLRRHGPMVRAVCRRALGEPDADDAFQATFLVLVRKAGSVRRGAPLANWLCGVAYKTARQALRTRRKLWHRERQVTALPESPAPPELSPNDWLPLLDAAIQALPERFRVPLILCDLESVSRSVAARILGVAEGTLSSRLARARHMLRRRLGGKMAPLAILAALAPVVVPGSLARATAQAATAFLPGSPLPVGMVPTRVLDLVKGVLSAMQLSSWKVGAGIVMVVALAGTILFGSVRQGLLTPAARGDDPPASDRPNPVPAKPADPMAEEQERLQGAWRWVSQETDGGAVEENKDVVIVFAGRRFLLAGRQGLSEGTYRVEPDSNPRRIDILDLKITECRDAPNVRPISKFGIYKLEGDRLTVCSGPDGKRSRRPAEFTTEKASGCTLIVLERVGATPTRMGGQAGPPKAPLISGFVDGGTAYRGAGQELRSVPANPDSPRTDPYEAVIPAGPRAVTLPIALDIPRNKDIREVALYMSADKGKTWEQWAVVAPDKREIPVTLAKPGLYWFSLVLTYKDGRREPADVNAATPMKVIVRDGNQQPATKEEDGPRNKTSVAAPENDAKRSPADADAFIVGNKITLPIRVDPARRTEIKQLKLYMSRDEGRTWTQVDAVSPDAERFELEVDEPGNYWFTVLATDKAGKTEPASARDAAPLVRVRIVGPKTEPKDKKSEATPETERRRAQAEAFREQTRTRLARLEQSLRDGNLRKAVEDYDVVQESLRFWEATAYFAEERDIYFWKVVLVAVECLNAAGKSKIAEDYSDKLRARFIQAMIQLRGLCELARGYKAEGDLESCRQMLQQMKDLLKATDGNRLDEIGVQWKSRLAQAIEDAQQR